MTKQFTIYAIKNIFNGRMYVGSTVNYLLRQSAHFSHLKFGKHKNRRLQKDYDRFGGRDAFMVIKICNAPTKEIAYKFEQIIMDGAINPYNILIAGGAKGRVYTPTTIKKMSEAAKERIITPEQRKKIAATKRGSKLSATARMNMSNAQKERAKTTLRHSHAKLSLETVYEIYKLRDSGMLIREIAEKVSTSNSTVAQIASGRAWKVAFETYYKINDKGAV